MVDIATLSSKSGSHGCRPSQASQSMRQMSNFSVENLATTSIIVHEIVPTLPYQGSKDWQSRRQVGYAQSVEVGSL